MTLSRVHPGHVLLGALLLAALLLGWRALGVIRQPLPAIPPFKAPQMADRSLLARFDPFFPARAGASEGLPVTALPFTLHGVRADSATGRGSAIIAAGDGMQKVYSVGDVVADGVTLAAIAGDHVVLDRAGTREALWIDSGGEAPVQRFDPGQAPSNLPPPAAGPGLTPENAPPSVMPDEEEEKPPVSAARAPAQEPQQ
jgi:general secretion pathway protein C